MKQHLLSLPPDDPQKPYYQARTSSLKMLLVCCFGYMGYKAAKFGRIESHEAISALGREALLRAKEAAEDMGFTRAAPVRRRHLGEKRGLQPGRMIFCRC